MTQDTLDYKQLPKYYKNQIATTIHEELLTKELAEDEMWMEMRVWRLWIEKVIRHGEGSWVFDEKNIIEFDSRSIFDICLKDLNLFEKSDGKIDKRFKYRIREEGSLVGTGY